MQNNKYNHMLNVTSYILEIEQLSYLCMQINLDGGNKFLSIDKPRRIL